MGVRGVGVGPFVEVASGMNFISKRNRSLDGVGNLDHMNIRYPSGTDIRGWRRDRVSPPTLLTQDGAPSIITIAR